VDVAPEIFEMESPTQVRLARMARYPKLARCLAPLQVPALEVLEAPLPQVPRGSGSRNPEAQMQSSTILEGLAPMLLISETEVPTQVRLARMARYPKLARCLAPLQVPALEVLEAPLPQVPRGSGSRNPEAQMQSSTILEGLAPLAAPPTPPAQLVLHRSGCSAR